MRIDFVSDVACPWCAVGFNALERALERIGGDLGEIELHMQPFELNPTMAPEGVDATEYLTSKYGLSPEQFAANRARIVERGAAEGFTFGRTYPHMEYVRRAPPDVLGRSRRPSRQPARIEARAAYGLSRPGS